jgi:hypothetical protein
MCDMDERSSVYLGNDQAAAVKACGAPLAELIRRGLAASTAEVAQPPAASAADASVAAFPGGEPSPGTLCMGPGCFQRDTARYGLRRLVLCRACAAALQGQTYQREIPPGAARIIKRTAA